MSNGGGFRKKIKTPVYLGKKKSDKSYNPGKGANYKKWEKAAREAEDTMGLTRQERVDQYMVSYAHKLLPSSQPKTPSSPKALSTPKTPSRTPGLSKPAGSPATPKGSSKRPLPRGWISETRTKDGKELTVYVSPDGEEFTVSILFLNLYIIKNTVGLISCTPPFKNLHDRLTTVNFV